MSTAFRSIPTRGPSIGGVADLGKPSSADDVIFPGLDPDGDGHIQFRDAAIQAELEIGLTEETPTRAWHHVLLRLGRMVAGFSLLLAGAAMMVLPGPGAVVMAAGLVVLSRDVAWADRALRYLRRKAPGLDEEGPIPKTTIAISLMLMVAAGLASWWWFTGGEDTVRGWF